MPSIHDVAQYFVAKGIDSEDCGMSNLKLQKLVYYAQGFHLALYDQPLFEERIFAWTHGPVSPDLYHKYKEHGKSPITDVEYNPSDRFTDEQIDFLEEIYEVFGQFSAWKLRNMTHSEPPWQAHEEYASEIPIEAMKEYFQTRVK
ncbi:Panacea domain-containing protein [Solemya velesiana gill symbiont]|uniref:Antitoxin SocA-like Panacea domain-containing protein n=1 Tax=Solemya velesiana gill symbiont TaxID=1918948 RepID=A0A1T2KS20_9GAMM|nr:type II toxin-antitoxin system antitoxin SocA domain-containing protein [Solemya velesiana gill symbiont]OOZ35622.1 hypothetical protein BOW51_11130 [Solemya velesiana gill symbiont]